MEQKLQLPTRAGRIFREHRGDYVDGEVEDRPYRVLKDQPNELRGTIEDVEEPLTDMEILLAGGLDVFFKDGKRVDANWPWTGEDKRTRKAVAKKPAKKKAKKKAAKKK